MIGSATEILAASRSILVFTGAGISTESGIPDFRGPEGVWTKVDPADFTIARYLNDHLIRRRSWSMRAESGVLDAEPNAGHTATTELWRTGRMAGCVTQNIDGLHQKAGLPGEAIIELHGNVHTTICVKCSARQPTTAVVDRVASGDTDPHCRICGGVLKVDVVFFGEQMPPGSMEAAIALAMRSDAVIAVGSTMSVYPAAYVPLAAVEQGAPLVIVNQGPTDLDRVAAAKIEAPAGPTLVEITRLLTSHS